MNSDDLKLFALFYIKEDEWLTDKEKVKLMEFVEVSNDEQVLYLLATGQLQLDESVTMPLVAKAVDAIQGGIAAKALYSASKAGGQVYMTKRYLSKSIPKEKPWGQTSLNLTGTAMSALATALALKMNKKYIAKMDKKCSNEKGLAKKTCHNKIRRDGIRAEIVSLTSMKVRCRKAKDTDICIRNIDKRIKELQNRMDSIKVF